MGDKKGKNGCYLVKPSLMENIRLLLWEARHPHVTFCEDMDEMRKAAECIRISSINAAADIVRGIQEGV